MKDGIPIAPIAIGGRKSERGKIERTFSAEEPGTSLEERMKEERGKNFSIEEPIAND